MLDQILKKCRPNEHLESIYQVDFNGLINKGIKGLILDLDETVLPRQIITISPVLFTFIERLKDMGFSIFLLSNSIYEARVEYVGRSLNIPYSVFSMKPFPFSFNKACKHMGLDPKEVAVVGDQLFMDILGGNLSGMHTILVDPMSHETFWLRKLMRYCEKWVLQKIDSFAENY